MLLSGDSVRVGLNYYDLLRFSFVSNYNRSMTYLMRIKHGCCCVFKAFQKLSFLIFRDCVGTKMAAPNLIRAFKCNEDLQTIYWANFFHICVMPTIVTMDALRCYKY